jgi:maleate isomerase
MIRLGMLTPSSNTALEPMTQAMLAAVPDVSAHFSRFKVTEIALSDAALRQFDDSEILVAAELLAHARVNAIAWNGTSAAWRGFETDEQLVARIDATTGKKACTAVLAFREIFRRTKAQRIGLVTPYTQDVQTKIMANWSGAGFNCTAEHHFGLRDNFSFVDVPEPAIADAIRSVVAQGCDAVAIVCTNMRGSKIAAALESEVGVPIYDSIAVTLWKSLQCAGVPAGRVVGWGRLFGDARLA